MAEAAKHAICPKCGCDYGLPADPARPGNCSECLMERVEIVPLQLKAPSPIRAEGR